MNGFGLWIVSRFALHATGTGIRHKKAILPRDAVEKMDNVLGESRNNSGRCDQRPPQSARTC